MVSKPGLRHWAVMLVGLGLIGSCTNILGIDTEYDPNPCTDESIEPKDCGQGACHVFLDKDERCVNGLPTECVEGTPGDQEVCKDGVDNNCDGNVDEMCPCEEGATQKCYNGSTDEWSFGLCMKRGSQICEKGAWTLCDSKVLPDTEVCGDGRDNDCDGKVDENCECTPGVPPKPCYGGPDDTEGIGICRSGTQKCKADGTWGECDGDVVPGTETWNGADDDCDGRTDNGFVCAKGTKQKCYDGVNGVDSEEITPKNGVTPECKAGEQDCLEGNWGPCLGQVKPQGEFCDGKDNDCNHIVDDGSFNVPELCNNKDDNCNGLVDEGNPGGGEVCNTGKPGPCKDGVTACTAGGVECQQNIQATTELCDGIDNDCNGAIDDGDPEGGTPCSAPDAIGACINGKTKCQTAKLVCIPSAPITESCNGIDDNCDNIIDNGNPGSGQPCVVAGKLGVCAEGSTNCVGGGPVCSQVVQPTAEICDSKDNDCNGATDDNVPGSGAPCTVSGLQGECAKGATACQNGLITCVQTAQPVPEICDGLDNNCNANVDEGDPGGGSQCNVSGQVGVCSIGVIKCSGGALSCTQTSFSSAELCDALDNDCDGQVDEGNPGGNIPCNTGKPGICASGVFNCISGAAICTQTNMPVPETCDGTDNDCDGQSDEGNPGGGPPCTVPGALGECAKGILACQNGVLTCTQVINPQAELCDGLDNSCNGLTDEGNPGGGVSCTTGQSGICSAGTTACTGGQLLCNANSQPSSELCDNLDNNCNGQVDENNPGGGSTCNTGQSGICSVGTTACTNGMIACNRNQNPTSEVCDGLDNNCNGTSDEGNPGGGVSCMTGQPGVCSAGTRACTGGALQCVQNQQASAEICDGLDNNCNGTSDEGNPGGGQACSTGQPGVCSGGTTACTNGSTVCTPNIQASAEICDGLDNNCNGTSDEGNPGGNQNCTTGLLGVCGAGKTNCSSGSIVCTQTTMSSTEVCNGLDDDCNGSVDNGNPGGGAACVTGQPGVCSAGTNNCVGGTVVCTPNTPSTSEVCDGLDNDCDGTVDDSPAQVGTACTTGLQGVCSAGTRACTAGMLVCNQTTMSSAEVCDGLDNDCDGTVDDSPAQVGTACTTGLQGVCSAGTRACTSGALVCNQTTMLSAELCNGLDDDCDGTVDDNAAQVGTACTTGLQGVCSAGTRACTAGSLVCNQTTMSSTETCDGLDNNCNGTVDDVAGVGQPCGTDTGECVAGVGQCSGGSVVCVGSVGPATEVCDGLDNDCNGTNDNGNPGGGVSCSTGLQGVCDSGTTACTGGAIVCNQTGMSSAEICDNLDNDCDGTIDDSPAQVGNACMTGLSGVCSAGTFACTAGALQCSQTTMAGTESCNLLDDNCDGTVDNGSFCCAIDTVKSGNESDINCGGACAQKCVDAGIECTANAQCGTGTCNTGIGKCNAQTCNGNGDCASGKCTAGTCVAPACNDGVKNPGEGDIDCGGPCAAKCGSTKTCNTGADCDSGNCSAGICQATGSCTDGSLNGTEGDVDCGGSCATKCANGKGCAVDGDCTSTACSRGLCVPSTCKNGTQDTGGGETGVDCGGPDCQVCPSMVALATSGSTSPYSMQAATFNGTAWSGVTSLASSSVIGTPSVALATTRHAVGVVRDGSAGNVDKLQFTRWDGVAGTWASLANLPGTPKANGAPVLRGFGPFIDAAFRFQNQNGKYYAARFYDTAWTTPFQATNAPSNATVHDLDWVHRGALNNAALVYPEQGSADPFFQFRSSGSWNAPAAIDAATINLTIQPSIVQLTNGDLLMVCVQAGTNKILFSKYNGATWSTLAVPRDNPMANGSGSEDKTWTTKRPALVPLPLGKALLIYIHSYNTPAALVDDMYVSEYSGTAWGPATAVVAGAVTFVTAVPGITNADVEVLYIEGGTMKHYRRTSQWDTVTVSGISSNVQAIGAASLR